MTVSAIVCAYNEEKTIKPILETLLSHPRICEVIVVDDGSTDRTWGVISSIKNDRLVTLRHPVNLGKGAAIADAAEKARREILLLIDADLVNFRPAHVDLLLIPLTIDQKIMTIGVREKGQEFEDNFHALLKSFGGERAVARRFIAPLIDRMRTSGYGAETILNFNHIRKGRDIVHVSLPKLIHRAKTVKHPIYRYITEYIKENKDVVKQFLDPQNRALAAFFKQITRKLGV